jgi:hypothetical protein
MSTLSETSIFKNDFDKDFFSGDFKSASIEDEIAKMKRDMFQLTSGESTLKVDQPFVEDFTGNKRMVGNRTYGFNLKILQ